MATLGISYFLDGFGQTLFGSDIYKIDVGMPKDPIFLFESMFQGGILVNKEDLYAAVIAAALVALLSAVLPEDRHRPRAARGGRRPPGGAVDRHSAQPHLGHRLERGRLRRAGGRHHLGQQAGRAVLAVAGGAEGAAGGDPRRPDLGARRDHRRADHRRRREALRGLHRPDCRRRHRDLVRLRAGAARSCWSGRRACSARRSSIGSEAACSTARTASSRPATAPTSRSSRSRRTASRSALLLAFAVVGVPLLAAEYLFRAILIPFLILSLAALGPEHPGRLLRPDLARHRRLHGGRRLRGLQLPGAHRRHAAGRWRCCSAACAPPLVGVLFGIPSLRIKGLYLAVATLAAQFFVDWAFLRIKWFTNDSSSGSVAWPTCSVFGMPIETPRAEVPVLPGLPGRVRAARQEPGAQPHRPRVDGDPRHGRGRRRDRHPPGATPSSPPSPSARSSSAWPARCGASSTWARGSRRRSRSTARSSCCSWSSSAAWARSWAASSAPPSSWCCRSSSNQTCRLGQLVRHHRSTPPWSSHAELMIFGALIVFFLIVEPHGLARLWSIGKEKLRLWPFPH